MQSRLASIVPLLLFSSLTICGTVFSASEHRLPVTLTEAPDRDLQYYQVIAEIEQYLDGQVRWGGEIIEIKHIDNITLLTVIEHPIAAAGEPDYTIHYRDESRKYVVEFDYSLANDTISRHAFITVFGLISGKTSVQDPEVEVPVIKVLDSAFWPSRKQHALNKEHDRPNRPQVTVGLGISTHGTHTSLGVKGQGENYQYQIQIQRSSSH